jgi:hypothetical protein
LNKEAQKIQEEANRRLKGDPKADISDLDKRARDIDRQRDEARWKLERPIGGVPVTDINTPDLERIKAWV